MKQFFQTYRDVLLLTAFGAVIILSVTLFVTSIPLLAESRQPEWHYFEMRCNGGVLVRSRSTEPSSYWENRDPHHLVIGTVPGRWELEWAEGDDCILENRDAVYRMRSGEEGPP